MKLELFKLPNGKQINLNDIETVSEPQLDWWRWFKSLIIDSLEFNYYTIQYKDGTSDKIYEDDELLRYKSLLIFLLETDGESDAVYIVR
ncbi:MAG: hypothetical protein K8S56_11015 [Candidatus Cloacimonetes bacterium]|nr:hypothetical protein [Candidatus Cloacimonadota bacterium]